MIQVGLNNPKTPDIPLTLDSFGALQSQLAKLMAKQMVEPKRKTIDIEKIWLDKRAEKGSGPGGMLCLTLVQARDLW